jgi:hypothetical protein
MSELTTTVVGPSDRPTLDRFSGPKGLVEYCWCTYFRMQRRALVRKELR